MSNLIAPQDYECAEHSEDDKPEPQEDIDLLVDDVLRQEAERIVLLLPHIPPLVEGAL